MARQGERAVEIFEAEYRYISISKIDKHVHIVGYY